MPHVPEKSQADIIPIIQAPKENALTMKPCTMPITMKMRINMRTIVSMNMGVI